MLYKLETNQLLFILFTYFFTVKIVLSFSNGIAALHY